MSTCPTCHQEIPIKPDTFGNRVQLARAAKGWDRSEMADEMGYERTSMITRWEEGTVVPKDIETVEFLSTVLDVTPAWLLYGVQEPKLFDVPDAVAPVDDQYAEDLVEGEEVVVDLNYTGPADLDLAKDEPESSAEDTVRRRPAMLDEILGKLEGKS